MLEILFFCSSTSRVRNSLWSLECLLKASAVVCESFKHASINVFSLEVTFSSTLLHNLVQVSVNSDCCLSNLLCKFESSKLIDLLISVSCTTTSLMDVAGWGGTLSACIGLDRPCVNAPNTLMPLGSLFLAFRFRLKESESVV